MTEDVFLDNFFKIYQKGDKKPQIFKAPYAMVLSGGRAGKRNFLTIPTTPDTLVGIRETTDNIFYVRKTDSEILYTCPFSELEFYSEDNWAKSIFLLLARLLKNTNIKGAQILFHNDCEEEEFQSRESALGVGIFKMLLKDTFSSELLKEIMKNEANFEKNALVMTKLMAEKNRCLYFNKKIKKSLPLNLKGGKIVLLKVEKPKKKTECEKCEYTTQIATSLQEGDISTFLDFLMREAEEYIDNLGKENPLTDLFKICKRDCNILGIYKDRGLICAVALEKIDEFIKNAGEEYEKLQGKKPSFYILEPSCCS